MDRNKIFESGHIIKTDLKKQTVHASLHTVTTQLVKFLSQILTVIILARYFLGPNEFGLISMVTTITGFALLFKDMGLAMATIQKSEITHEQVSTLFWTNCALGILITGLVVALSPLTAWFYGESRLTSIMMVMSLTFLFSGITIQHQALLRRIMMFRRLAIVECTAYIFGVIFAIFAAIKGAGYWALIILPLSSTIVIALGVWLALGWIPRLPTRNTGARSMFSFGGNITAFRIINYFSRNFDRILLGKVWGATDLGYYTNAYRLLMLPLQQINQPLTIVAIPALSRLRETPERYRRFYRKAIFTIVFIGMPIIVFLFTAADRVILSFLGDNWSESIILFRLLGPAAFLGTFNVATGWAYITLGNVKRQLYVGILWAILTCVGFLIGIHWGSKGIAASFSICLILFRLPSILICFKNTCLKLSDLFTPLFYPTFTSIGAGFILWYINKCFIAGDNNSLALLFVNFIVYTISYIFLWIIIPNTRPLLFQTLSLVKELKSKK